MSWLSKATGIHLGNIGAPIGALIGSVIPGVGTAIGAGLGQGIGALGSGKSLPVAAGQGVVAGTAAKALPIAGKAIGGLLGGGGSAGGDVAGGDDPSSDNPDGGGGFDLGDLGGGIVDILKKYGPTALEGLNIYNSAQRQGQSDKYAQDAINGATERFNKQEPLRVAGQAGLLNPSAGTPDLSNIRQISTAGSGNPFAKALPVAGAAAPFKPSGALPVAQTGPIPNVPPNPDGSIWLPGGAKPTGQSTYPAPGQPGALPLALAPAMTGQQKVGGLDPKTGKPLGALPVAQS